MNDRELLEAAAKAAGYPGFDVASFWSKGYRVRDGSGDGWQPWNPLTDDGDALRLAVKMGITITPLGNAVQAWGSPVRGIATEVIYDDGDPAAATRRAIVRAAAALGGAL